MITIKSTIDINFILLLLFTVSCCSSDQDPGQPLYLDPQAAVEDRVDDLMPRMSLREKIAQMNLSVGSYSPFLYEEAKNKPDSLRIDSVRNAILSGMVGSWYINDQKYGEVLKSNEIQKLARQSRLKIPVLITTDAIHGHGQFPGTTIFPTPVGIASTWDPDLAEMVASITAKELRATGFHWALSPNVDVVRDPRWGRTGESFGEDPFLVSEMGRAFVRGYEQRDTPGDQRVLSCLKHYAAGGIPVNGINIAPSDISERTLREIFLLPYAAGIEEGAWSIMAAHNEIGGVPCHASEFLLKEILREELGFEGFVISDWLDIARLETIHSIASDKKESIRLAVAAGVDMHNFGLDFIEPLAELVEQGLIPEGRIDRAVRTVLRAKFELGLFENPFVDGALSRDIPAHEEHKRASLEIARKTIILLKNDENLLPLTVEMDHIFVTGPNANNLSVYGDWVFPQPEEPVTILDGIRSACGAGKTIDYFDCGNFRTLDESRIRIAATRASKADVAIVVAGGNGIRYQKDEHTVGEDIARSDIYLPGLQTDLLQAIHATGTPVVLVLLGGRPLAIPWEADHIPAIVQAWEPGMMAGHAVAEVLNGAVNPGGKLPFTLLRSVGHIGNYYNHKPSQFFQQYQLSRHDAVYPFGHGLSYTSFAFEDLEFPAKVRWDEEFLQVSLMVTNTGPVPGDEVVQVYINDRLSSVTQPVKRLVGFRRIALAPGESQAVTMDIPMDRLKLVNLDMEWVLEPGEFLLMVGSSSADIRQEGVFEVLD